MDAEGHTMLVEGQLALIAVLALPTILGALVWVDAALGNYGEESQWLAMIYLIAGLAFAATIWI